MNEQENDVRKIVRWDAFRKIERVLIADYFYEIYETKTHEIFQQQFQSFLREHYSHKLVEHFSSKGSHDVFVGINEEDATKLQMNPQYPSAFTYSYELLCCENCRKGIVVSESGNFIVDSKEMFPDFYAGYTEEQKKVIEEVAKSVPKTLTKTDKIRLMRNHFLSIQLINIKIVPRPEILRNPAGQMILSLSFAKEFVEKFCEEL